MFANNNTETEKCRRIVDEFSNNIGMSFGLDNCAVIHTLCEKFITSPTSTETPQLSGEDSYKYLAMMEGCDILHFQVKEGVSKEYVSRVRNILQTDISIKNTVAAVNSYTMLVLRYGIGVICRKKG